jgi:type II secretory pathway component PulM|tara:strand:+ start:276 stop:683 length:408 start_codon:yes stop_codon:yes gene_type:complete
MTFLLIWTFAWEPLEHRVQELEILVSDKNNLLANLRRMEALNPILLNDARNLTAQSLVVLVDETHRDHGLNGSLSRNQPDGDNGIRVVFQTTSFDRLIGWLGMMELSYGIKVESASFDGARQSGVVNATLVLRRI